MTPTRQFLCAVRDDGADQEPRHGTSHASATAQLPEADEGCGAQGTPGVLSFPDGYPEGAAREIVTQLLHATPAERLGADRCAQILVRRERILLGPSLTVCCRCSLRSIGAAGGAGGGGAAELLASLKAHGFWEGVAWDAVRAQAGPELLAETEEEREQKERGFDFTIE